MCIIKADIKNILIYRPVFYLTSQFLSRFLSYLLTETSRDEKRGMYLKVSPITSSLYIFLIKKYVC